MTTSTTKETGNDIRRVYVVGLVVAATLMVADVALMGLGLAIGLRPGRAASPPRIRSSEHA